MMNGPQVLKPGERITVVVTIGEIYEILKNLYGIVPKSLIELNGYDDKNYKVVVHNPNSNNDDQYVLKLMNSWDSQNVALVEGQNSIMLFLNSNGITCPKPVMNVNGKYYSIERFISGKHCVRLLEYVPGNILKEISPGPALYYQIGVYVAELDCLLKDFYHPAYDSHKLIWMLDSIPNVKEFLIAIEDDEKGKIINSILNEFENRVLSVSNTLEKGMIHGDINEQNIIVQSTDDKWELKGLIDFGDCNRSCYLFELAITITYMLILSKDLDVAGYVFAGYNSVRNVTNEEYSLLKICIMSRLCQSYTIGVYSYLQHPNNTYVLSSVADGWEILTRLREESEKDTLSKWKLIADNYEHVVEPSRAS
ncbi:hypothetical protein PPYR_07134 [Photinus pyralis]|uniref:Hydroxylysine kinase n=2 Tax=Photinus pyralis TaxID=7054 RepID=A0A5N4APL0_PHOPY|nr:hydroxylysine kinase [Photinus pyralis]KAB0799254.1 hypothetical protein PPYR_07134 [Photinus pyralis]